ncbi:uncharacterized protein B0H18DRAFT_95898 [Fomitopsis serialis]|uniref:uncharacterized protein n=1 Tax=Fomitopsis serialis TaxID=139415 RepID=UPI0020089A8E|nr:uncharacterized protein B0H18DRAFT_95898 [Neoantrodia serialis]KAH9915490.1 hypothetical protein B0H18DRAFT_95898 [Neoantrodia serialis]
MYQMGILRAEVIGLQCIGFNHRLNEELHSSKSPSDDASLKSDTDGTPLSSLLKRRKRPVAVVESSDDSQPPKKEAKISG